MSGGNPDFSFDGDYSFSDSHPTTAAGQDARNNQHQNNDSVDMGSPGGGAGGDVASSFSSDQLPGEDDEATAARVAGAGAEGNGAGGAGGGASSGVGREGCGWPCVVCTFVNEVDQSQCAMCTTPGPPLAERQAAEVQGGVTCIVYVCVCFSLSLQISCSSCLEVCAMVVHVCSFPPFDPSFKSIHPTTQFSQIKSIRRRWWQQLRPHMCVRNEALPPSQTLTYLPRRLAAATSTTAAAGTGSVQCHSLARATPRQVLSSCSCMRRRSRKC